MHFTAVATLAFALGGLALPTEEPANPSRRRCPPREIFTTCGGCPVTCNSGEFQICTLECRVGCYCAEGLIRGPDGSCIPRDECPLVLVDPIPSAVTDDENPFEGLAELFDVDDIDLDDIYAGLADLFNQDGAEDEGTQPTVSKRQSGLGNLLGNLGNPAASAITGINGVASDSGILSPPVTVDISGIGLGGAGQGLTGVFGEGATGVVGSLLGGLLNGDTGDDDNDGTLLGGLNGVFENLLGGGAGDATTPGGLDGVLGNLLGEGGTGTLSGVLDGLLGQNGQGMTPAGLTGIIGGLLGNDGAGMVSAGGLTGVVDNLLGGGQVTSTAGLTGVLSGLLGTKGDGSPLSGITNLFSKGKGAKGRPFTRLIALIRALLAAIKRNKLPGRLGRL